MLKQHTNAHLFFGIIKVLTIRHHFLFLLIRELSEEEGVPVHREIPGHSEHSGSQERKARVDLEERPVTKDFPGL